MFSFSIQLRGQAKLWTASIVFAIVGFFIAFDVPVLLEEPVADGVVVLLRILGGTFLALGSFSLTLLLVGLRIQRQCPHNLPVWHWWINFLGGLLGACSFAIPSILIFPVFYAFYVNRPNALFPENESEHGKNLLLASVFSLVGLVVLAAVYLVGRLRYQGRPRWHTLPPETPNEPFEST